MKFLGDMGLSQSCIRWLREQGHEAVHLRELGLQRMPDPLILAKSVSDGFIPLTMDLGFGALLAANQQRLPSVVIFRLDDETPKNVNRHLKNILDQYAGQLSAGALLSVRENLIRIRILPIGTSSEPESTT